MKNLNEIRSYISFYIPKLSTWLSRTDRHNTQCFFTSSRINTVDEDYCLVCKQIFQLMHTKARLKKICIECPFEIYSISYIIAKIKEVVS